jgi:hypothetical protein
MDPTGRQGTWSTAAKLAIVVLAGLIVLVLLLPVSGVDTLPPECYSVFGYTVPCGSGISVAAGAAAAAIIGLLLWFAGRPRGKG